jgi:hypothetical protein
MGDEPEESARIIHKALDAAPASAAPAAGRTVAAAPGWAATSVGLQARAESAGAALLSARPFRHGLCRVRHRRSPKRRPSAWHESATKIGARSCSRRIPDPQVLAGEIWAVGFDPVDVEQRPVQNHSGAAIIVDL